MLHQPSETAVELQSIQHGPADYPATDPTCSSLGETGNKHWSALRVRAIATHLNSAFTGSARGSGSRYSNGKHANRKDARKQERMDKKSRRAQHRTPGAPQFSTTAPPHNGKKRPAPSAHLDEPTRKKSRTSDGKPVPDRAPVRSTQRSDEKTPATRRPHVIEVAPPPQRRGQRSIPPKPTIKGGKTEAPPSLRTRQEQEEDAYIAHLESKLGWRKGGRKTKSFGSGLDNDGLDGMLILAVRDYVPKAHERFSQTY